VINLWSNGNLEKERIFDGKGGNSAWNDREMEKKGGLSVEVTLMPAVELVMSVWVGSTLALRIFWDPCDL